MDDQRPLGRTPGGEEEPRPDMPDKDSPDAGDLGRLGEEGGPVGLRVGRNPANLGDEVPAEADLTYPEPLPKPPDL